MFHKLHLQMTLFCTAVTGIILILLTVICLFIAEKGLKSNRYASFLNETSSILTHLQSQEVVSLQWINQLREKNDFTFLFYDQGKPLFSQRLTSPEHEIGGGLLSRAVAIAKEDHSIDLFSENNDTLPSHAEFSLSDGSSSYYVSAGTIPKKNGTFSFLIFYSLKQEQQQLRMQRLAFALADLCGILLLILFSYIFTGRMLRPIAENNKKQTLFIASASHELRTPLSVILSGIEALEKSDSVQERRHFIDLMRCECGRMQHLISDMLFLAGSDAGSPALRRRPCQPDEILLSVYEKYELLAHSKHLTLKIVLPQDSLPDCFCDPERIQQVLIILIDNALSYTPSGGVITLSVSQGKTGRKAFICFTVSDTGPGIPDEHKKQIFERFYRAERSHTDKSHFGLGLCIAKEIVDSHHGKIYVTDQEGGGACFHVEL